MFGTQLLVLVEIFSRMHTLNTDFGLIFSQVGNFLLYALNPLLATLWFMYIHYQIHSSDKLLKNVWYYGLLVVGLNLIIVLINLKFGFLYTLSSNYAYERGTVFMLTELLNLTILLGTVILILMYKKRLTYEHIKTYLIVILIPMIGLVLQIFFEGYPVAVHSVVLALIVKYVNLQNKKINHDYLTGLFNRRQLDYYIEDI
ncbi:hypothetical protein [Acholeplasma hippikon]|uniref:Histidine kinase N-terminal 7TM region domain-containing protein n=1 Tax=Acholeplasma hippikon TaxID=264636 RepID=A0A449BK66_9MOLU|nr:hypothetical protein [Acholeplasma hippikon]VEU82783.1 Uncharacterised protein [Acholeplasma hippikon]